MTREEKELTITYLTEMQEEYIEGEGYERHPLPEYYALDTAIKVLNQPTSNDCVSRQAVIDMTGVSDWFESSDDYNSFVEDLCKLPPVTPTRIETVTEFADRCRECGKMKKGKWIDTGKIDVNRRGQIVHEVICSECNGISYFRSMGNKYIGANLCPNCGSRNER